MELATAAMEKVPLTQSSDSTVSSEITPSSSSQPTGTFKLPVCPSYSEVLQSTPPSIWEPFINRIHALFNAVSHATCSPFLRLLSTIMFFVGVIGGIILQQLAFYHTGALNLWTFLICLLYVPILIGFAIIREDALASSRTTVRISREVAIACVVIFISITMCMAMAVVLRLQHYVSAKEMWISIGGISMFVYNVFMSEVLMAAAVSLKKELDMEREGRQREVEDPSWFTTYQAVTSARTMTDRAL